MSCEITSGITTGCNDQVGGIVGIHYFQWYPDLVVEKDANGVITRIYRASNPTANINWKFIQADNGMGSVTETYNVGGTGSILGFHQSASFFIPETATPSANDPTQKLNEFVQMLAAQNNLVIGIETGDNAPMQSYSKKCFVFGLERPAYCASGSKETGVVYGDNNGYNLELAADSKAPMQEIAYMAMHNTSLDCPVQGGAPDFTTGNYFNLQQLVQFEGGNIRDLTGAGQVYPELYVMPGELLTVEAVISMDWGPAAFSGNTFLPEWEISYTGQSLNYVGTLPTAPGIAQVVVKGTYENTTSSVQGLIPIKLVAPQGVNISGSGMVPIARFLTITRST